MADQSVIKEFLVSLGYTVDGNTEKKFNNSLKGAVVQANLLADAITGMARIVVEGVQKVAQSFDALYYTSQRTGASVQNIRALSYAVSQLGGSYEGAQGAIEAFGQHLRSNPGYTSLLNGLGIKTSENGKMRDQVEILEDLGKALSKKPYAQALQYAGALGIDENTMRAIMSGDLSKQMAEYNKIQESIGLNADDAAKKSKDFMQSLRELQSTVEAVATKILTDLEPAIADKLRTASQWFIDHKDDIKAFVVNLGEVVTALIKDLGKVVDGLKPLFTEFDDIAKSLTGKDGLQAAFEVFAVYLTGSWLLRILGVFGKFRIGWALLLAGMAMAPDNLKDAKENGDAANDWLGSTRIGSALVNGRNKVRGWFGMAPLNARGETTGSAATAASTSLEPHQKALLDTIAGPESGGSYNTLYGGGKFSSYNDHPRQSFTIQSGPNAGKHTSAAGRYQFLSSTWDDQASKLGLNDFSPANQDQAAWNLAKETYRNKTGGNLDEALKSGDPNTLANVSAVLSGTWTSLPGGIEQGTNKNRFVSTYARSLAAEQKKSMNAKISGGASPLFSQNHPAFSSALGGLGSINGAAPLGASGFGAGSAAGASVSQTTSIVVNGATDPHATASAIATKQTQVNTTMQRNLQGAVR